MLLDKLFRNFGSETRLFRRTVETVFEWGCHGVHQFRAVVTGAEAFSQRQCGEDSARGSP